MRKQINRSTRVFVILLSIALFMPPAPPERPHWSIVVKMLSQDDSSIELQFNVIQVVDEDPKASLGHDWKDDGHTLTTIGVAPNNERANKWLGKFAYEEAVQAADSYAREANENPSKWAGHVIRVEGPNFVFELKP